MNVLSEVAGLAEEQERHKGGGEEEVRAAKRQAELVARTLRALKLGLGRLWRRQSVTITEYDPSFKVAYLGNVLTGWAKGEGCVEKPVGTLWRNYCASTRADVAMTVTVSAAGLRAVTREHGLTEYWSHRITFCAAPPAFPRVFAWVYRHEGRRLKQELRCHAVLCSKASVARTMASQLQARLGEALREFRRDKLGRQKARLSLANALYAQPSQPRRRILLSTGASNYRPPLERSKSAPKLGPIDEISEEESINMEEEDEEEERTSREGGSLSSESGVVLAACLLPTSSPAPLAPCPGSAPDLLEVCGGPPDTILPEESDESGYDEGLTKTSSSSGGALKPLSSSSKSRKIAPRKPKPQVSFSDEISESSDDSNPHDDSSTNFLIKSVKVDDSELNERISSLTLCDDEEDEGEGSVSDDGSVEELTSSYIPSTCVYGIPGSRSSESLRPSVSTCASDDDLLTSVLRCMASVSPTSTAGGRVTSVTSPLANNNEGACSSRCGVPSVSTPPRPISEPPRLHVFSGATVDSSYVEV